MNISIKGFQTFTDNKEEKGNNQDDKFLRIYPGKLQKFLKTVRRDISGYEKLQIKTENLSGTICIKIEDCFHNIWEYKSACTGKENIIDFPFGAFKITDKAKKPALKFPVSLETLTILISSPDIDNKSSIKPEENLSDFPKIISINAAGSKGLSGPSMSIDPVFDYYKNQSWDKTAEILNGCGYTNGVVIFTCNLPYTLHNEMVDSLHKSGLAATIRINPPTDFEAFEEHPEWRQNMLDGSSRHDWRVYLCPNKEGFAKYYSDKISDIIKNTPYDCLQLAEPWFEVWGGAYPSNPTKGKYGCLCETCRKKFLAISGKDAADLFNAESPLYFELPQNKALYQKWIDFRCESINQFCKRIVDDAKKARPEIKIGYMYLSDATVEPDMTREYQAQDFDGILETMKPDLLIIQDAWQDWTRTDLSPEFARVYGEAYIARAKKIVPGIKTQVHADLGSRPEMKRSLLWMHQFSGYAASCGFDGTAYYEFTLNIDQY